MATAVAAAKDTASERSRYTLIFPLICLYLGYPLEGMPPTVEGTNTLVNFLWKHSHRHSCQCVWLIPYAARLASRITTIGPMGNWSKDYMGAESGSLLFEHEVLSSMPITSNKIAKDLCTTYEYPLICLKQTV